MGDSWKRMFHARDVERMHTLGFLKYFTDCISRWSVSLKRVETQTFYSLFNLITLKRVHRRREGHFTYVYNVFPLFLLHTSFANVISVGHKWPPLRKMNRLHSRTYFIVSCSFTILHYSGAFVKEQIWTEGGMEPLCVSFSLHELCGMCNKYHCGGTFLDLLTFFIWGLWLFAFEIRCQ